MSGRTRRHEAQGFETRENQIQNHFQLKIKYERPARYLPLCRILYIQGPVSGLHTAYLWVGP